jgi:hypothetical protein
MPTQSDPVYRTPSPPLGALDSSFALAIRQSLFPDTGRRVPHAARRMLLTGLNPYPHGGIKTKTPTLGCRGVQYAKIRFITFKRTPIVDEVSRVYFRVGVASVAT